ncbi:MAG TPA: bifunctional riboflavin kinase/FAD synthetase [Chitinophagales bacterium]|nr:bifunctional riboflavin kinase/FAD synthetase [Chitinophagales bacterium]
MRVFKGVDNLPEFRNAVLTIGTFDGVHTGHQEIIRRINRLAAEMNGENIILTFHPHPRMVLQPNGKELKLLNTLDEKISLLSKYGVDNLIIAPFTKEFSQITPQAYVEDFLWKKIHPRKVVVGYNHRFGRNRSGDITLLRTMGRRLGFDVEEIEAQTWEHISVSSTKIRNALAAGDLDTANSLLGHYYSVTGKVVRGDQRGKKIGYPTANIAIRDPLKLIPVNGVYAVRVLIDETTYGGMLNIGIRPTFNGKNRTLEVHIFDFGHDIYGNEITVEFVSSIRKEMKFNSADELAKQLALDKKAALKILGQQKTV